MGRGNDVIDGEGGLPLQSRGEVGAAGKPAAGGLLPPLGIDGGDLLNNLKEAGTARDTVGFEGGGNCQADGFFGSGGISNDEIGGEGIQSALDTFHRGKEGFEIDGEVGTLFHCGGPPFRRRLN